MKKILLSIFTIGLVGTVAAFGITRAFFSDTETSTGNILAAGAIDLLIDNESYVTNAAGVLVASPSTSWTLRDLTVEKFFNFLDLKPGDVGEDTISVHVNNNDAWACANVSFPANGNLENDVTEPESDLDDTGPAGELAQELYFAFWNDDGDNVFETNENIAVQGLASNIFPAGGTLALAQPNGTALFGNNPLTGAETYHIGKVWCYGTLTETPEEPEDGNPVSRGTGFSCDGSGVGNISQSDSLVGDISFYAIQSRNNATFNCSQVVWPQAQGLKVGAALASYDVPDNCDVTVNGGDLQAAVNGATPGQTVCVDDGSYSSVLIDKPLTLASLTGPDNTATIAGVRIHSSDVTVTGFKLTPAFFPTTHAAVYMDQSVDNVTISFNDIDGTGYVAGASRGIETLFNGTYNNVAFVQNFIHNLTTGIYTNPHTGNAFLIEYNDIDDNTAGIGGFTSATVRYNEFGGSGSGEAIGADNSYDGSVVSFNNFLTGWDVNTYVGLTPDISAPNNWWADGAANQTGGTDEVNFTPEAGVQYAHN